MPTLRIKDIAPHLAGRMLPALFSAAPEFKKPRFPGDPWAVQPHWAAWHWMHTTECGEPNHIGSSKSWTISIGLRIIGEPPQGTLF
jgi:hypothetical protein